MAEVVKEHSEELLSIANKQNKPVVFELVMEEIFKVESYPLLSLVNFKNKLNLL
jgi:hypothetical protein